MDGAEPVHEVRDLVDDLLHGVATRSRSALLVGVDERLVERDEVDPSAQVPDALGLLEVIWPLEALGVVADVGSRPGQRLDLEAQRDVVLIEPGEHPPEVLIRRGIAQDPGVGGEGIDVFGGVGPGCVRVPQIPVVLGSVRERVVGDLVRQWWSRRKDDEGGRAEVEGLVDGDARHRRREQERGGHRGGRQPVLQSKRLDHRAPCSCLRAGQPRQGYVGAPTIGEAAAHDNGCGWDTRRWPRRTTGPLGTGPLGPTCDPGWRR